MGRATTPWRSEPQASTVGPPRRRKYKRLFQFNEAVAHRLAGTLRIALSKGFEERLEVTKKALGDHRILTSTLGLGG